MSNVKADEEIAFFPTIGWLAADGNWHLPIQGCVSEPEPRRLALAVLRKTLRMQHVDISPAEDVILAERARLFMVDHERRKRVVVQIGQQRYSLRKSGADGWFRDEVVLTLPQARALAVSVPNQPPSIRFQACLPDGDSRVFSGRAMLVGTEGLVVVSDIDDTIKVSQVGDRNALLRSTFLERSRPVTGMPEVFRAWASAGSCHFCYVSASPWPLFGPLSEFIATEGFPDGTFHLRQVRFNDRSLLNLLQGPAKHKFASIEPLFEKFPERRFVLIGDSGEQDPEIYADLARKYPRQVASIFIRDLSSFANSNRFEVCFRGLDRSLWTCFRDPATLPGTLSSLGDAPKPRSAKTD